MKYLLAIAIFMGSSLSQAAPDGTVTTLDEVASCAYREMANQIAQFRTDVGIRTHNQAEAIRAGVYSTCIVEQRKGILQEPEKILKSFNVGIAKAFADMATPEERYNAAFGTRSFNFNTSASHR